MSSLHVNINLNPKFILRVLWACAMFLIICGVAAAYIKFVLGYPTAKNFVPRFTLDAEANFPTYFSSFILLIAAAILYLIAKYKNTVQDEFTGQWRFLCGLFFYMSIDESAAIHDMFNSPMKEDMIIGSIVVFVLSIYFYKFLLSIPTKNRIDFIIAGACYIGGALGLEIIGGAYRLTIPAENFTYGLFTIVEESLEMIGVLLFIGALFRYLDTLTNKFTLKIEDTEAGIPAHKVAQKYNRT